MTDQKPTEASSPVREKGKGSRGGELDMDMDMELARRAVACDEWRWMDGASDDMGRRIFHANAKGAWYRDCNNDFFLMPDNALPDLTDPATLGCLLYLVRELLGDPEVHLDLERSGFWSVRLGNPTREIVAADTTEARALITALECGKEVRETLGLF